MRAQREITDIEIEELTDEQIQQLIREMNSRGLTLDQAIGLAKARGATPQQIDQITRRIRQVQAGGADTLMNRQGEESFLKGSPKDSSLFTKADSAKVKKEMEIPEKTKRLFGFQLFNKKNLTFEPSVNIPVPPGYALGAGDEVVIRVWGASQHTYTLRVDTDGSVYIPDLGPIQVANMPYSEAKELILKRLTAIYDAMGGPAPATFADVVVNNPRSIKVNVIGEAIAPGTYTLPATASAFNALYLSGGPGENGSFRQINVIRDNKVFATIDVYDYLINANTAANIPLRNQDILFIPVYQKRVETVGPFKRRAIFELKEGETVSDLLRYSGGFDESASASRLRVTRFTGEQYRLIDIGQSEFSAFRLQNGDLVRAEKVINRFENRLTIEGAVFRPGSYALEQGMTLAQLIRKAGGLREDYFSPRGLVIRLDDRLYPTTIAFDVEEVVQGKADIPLQREDQVIIRRISGIGEKPTVHISGEVMRPDQYDFKRNMSLKDLIFLAGGMTEAASESYVEVARRNSPGEAGIINSQIAGLHQFRIDRNLQLNGEDANFKLEPFDHVYIRKAPSYEKQKTVFIRGEVKYPGEYSISNKNERISDLVKRAGGITPYAFAEGAKLKRQLDGQLLDQLAVMRSLQSNLDSTIRVDTTQRYANLELRLKSILEKPRSSYDYFLKEADEITIPMESEEIWVNGEVLNPIGLAWEKGKSLKYYVYRSGGFSSNAKRSKAYVIYSNGTTQVTRGFLLKDYPAVKPGSRIIVPARPERKEQGRNNWLAITSALSTLAIAFAAVFR